MKTFMPMGGNLVAAGTYWSFAEGELVRLEAEGALPGSSEIRFFRLPVLLLLLMSPLLGLLFVMFLPVAGLALTLYLSGKALVRRLRRAPLLTGAPLQIDREES